MEPASGPTRTPSSNAAAAGVTGGLKEKGRRAALACIRCKSRKQSCSGVPACTRCVQAGAECRYVEQVPKEDAKRSRDYAKRLEFQISQLEQGLSALDPDNTFASDHLFRPESIEEQDEVASEDEWAPEDFGIGYLSLGAAAEAQSPSATLPSESVQISPVSFSLPSFLVSLVARERAPPPPSAIPPACRSIDVANLDEAYCQLLHSTYFDHAESRYPFLARGDVNVERSRRAALVASSCSTVSEGRDAESSRELFVTLMVFAVSSALIGDKATASAFRHMAVKHAMSVFNHHTIDVVKAVLLLAVYSLFADDGPFPWTLSGVSIRLCVELGLHVRESSSRAADSAQDRQMTLYSAYMLDRLLHLSLGRPLLLLDRDIDVKLPSNAPLFLIQLKLCRLGTSLVSASTLAPTLRDDLSNVRADLDAARDDGHSLMALASLELSYISLSLLGLLPTLLSANVAPAQLRDAVRTSGNVSQMVRTAARTKPLACPPLVLLELAFRCGVVIMYCLFRDPEVVQSRTLDDLFICGTTLTLLAERWPSAAPTRDLYETLLSAFTPRFARSSDTTTFEERVRVPRATIEALSVRLEEARHQVGLVRGERKKVWAMVKALVIVV